MRAWVSFRAAALPTETRCSNSDRSSALRVTRYFSIAGLLPPGRRFTQQTGSRTTRQSKIDGILEPVHGRGAEVGEAVSSPQSAVPSEAIAVVGPRGDLRVAPGLVGDAGKPRQQQEAQIAEVGDRLGPDRGFASRDVRRSPGPERFGGFPVERLGDGPG